MYLAVVFLTMFALPVGAILIEHSLLHSVAPVMALVGKWFVFWAAGVRLALAGLRQYFEPRFTAEQIFGIKGDGPLPLVRELGIANFATGNSRGSVAVEAGLRGAGRHRGDDLLRRRRFPARGAACQKRQGDNRHDERSLRLPGSRGLFGLCAVVNARAKSAGTVPRASGRVIPRRRLNAIAGSPDRRPARFRRRLRSRGCWAPTTARRCRASSARRSAIPRRLRPSEPY